MLARRTLLGWSRASDRGRRTWYGVVLAIVAFAALTTIFEGDDPAWNAFANCGQLLAAFAATLACAARARREHSLHASLLALRRTGAGDASELALQRQNRIAWMLLAAGMAAWAAGQTGWTVYEVGLGVTPPSPSGLDALFLGSAVLIVVGLLAMVRTPAGRLSQLRGVAEALFLAGGCFLLSWSLIGPAIRASEATVLSNAVNLAYPMLDATALAVVLFVALRRGDEPPAGLGLLGLGIVCLAVSDGAFWYLSDIGSGLPGATPLYTGWVAGFLLIALAAAQHPASPERRNRRGLLPALPALPAGAGVVAVATRWLVADRVSADEELLGILATLVLLGVALLLIVFYENRALMGNLEQLVRRRTRQLRAAERYYRRLVQRSSDIVMVIGPDLRVRYASDSIHAIFGLPPAKLASEGLDAFGEEAAGSLREALERAALTPHHATRLAWELTDASGRRRRAESTITNMLADAHVRAFVLNTRDDTDRAALEEQLRHQALHDPLTGLANRALLSDRARQSFLRARRTGGSIAVMVLDVDSFKLVNDRIGHHGGDLLLQSVAERLSLTVRPEDTVARFGGDEFVVLIDAVRSEADARALAERVLDAMRQPHELGEQRYELTVSVGVAIDSPPHSNFEQLLSDADVAMYAVKTGGRDGVQLFEPRMRGHARERFQLQTELREGLERGELWLSYQPEFDSAGERLEGFETLVRWNHPTRGLLMPDRFIPLAEDTGLIVPLGRWVLQESLSHAASWELDPNDAQPLTISVNVSAVQLRSPSLVSDIQSALARSGIAPARVVLEITESSLIDGSPRVLDLLRELKELGVRLAIDDFGTGYASISYLQKVPVDILKVDRSFVVGSENGRGRELLEAIVNIGRVLSLVTIAEGVEQPGQLETARRVGCDFVQGYLLSRPLPEEGVRRLIAERSPAPAHGGPQPPHALERR